MYRARLTALAVLLFVADSTTNTGQTLETYRAKHRIAAELVPIAEAALGNDGQVVLDSRTATLILSGRPEAVRRALAMLEKVDRPLRRIVLTHQLRDQRDLDTVGARVAWKASLGSIRIGTLPLPAEGLHVALGAGRQSRSSISRATLRLLEGGSGLIVTGEALPFVYEPYWGTTTFVPVETGFEATASILGDGRVRIDLRPFSGRMEESGALRYTMATTSLTISPGETVVVAEVSGETVDKDLSLGGGRRMREQVQQVLLLSVEIEQP